MIKPSKLQVSFSGAYTGPGLIASELLSAADD
jgi:hypothetical protein